MRPVVAARAAVFVVAMVFMQAGPIWRTGFDRPLPPFLHAWRMYHNRGDDQCVLSTYLLSADPPREVDWVASLPLPPEEPPPEVTSIDQGVAIARRLCRVVPFDVGVAAVVTCTSRATHTWQPPSDTADIDVCRPKDRVRKP